MFRSNLFVILSCFWCLSTFAQEVAPFKRTLEKMELDDGDTLVFLGDSITHQCLYTQYVEDYFYTRYPDKRIRFHNSGVGGDRTIDALIRFEKDVAQFNPKYATILLGMNDGSYTNFKHEVFDRYEDDMTELLDRLAASGAKAIPMTPTMFDSRAAKIRDQGRSGGGKGRELRNNYYNAVLSFYGMWLQEEALNRGLGFVDMHSPLNDLTIEQRKTNPNFTLIRDAVHPGPGGQVVMALAVLEDMHSNRQVSTVNGNRNRRGEWTMRAAGGEVTGVEGTDDSVKFTFAANALPWVLPTEAAEGFELTNAGQKMSRERVRLTGLAPGKKYTLTIDGQVVGSYWAQRLADGIELQSNAKTPQYQQALKVAELNKERNDEAYRKIRNLWGKRKGMRRSVERAKPELKSEKQREMDEWLPTFEEQLKTLHALAMEYEDKIYAANQPVSHVYEVSR